MGYREDLYAERAAYAETESECADLKKRLRVGGLFWRIISWVEDSAARDRLAVQAEIDALDEAEGRKIPSQTNRDT